MYGNFFPCFVGFSLLPTHISNTRKNYIVWLLPKNSSYSKKQDKQDLSRASVRLKGQLPTERYDGEGSQNIYHKFIQAMKHPQILPRPFRRRQRRQLDNNSLHSGEDHFLDECPHLQLLGTMSLAYMHIFIPLMIIFAIIGTTLYNMKGLIVNSIPGCDILVLNWRKIRYQLRRNFGNNPNGSYSY